ncbi:MAG: aldehyde ferredoxin oxidoreductase family protein [Pirellulaceae bacterium]|nr:aldehyde ferredoxin oxidoreductase family protein [Pirellulaceae bacterium]
MRQPITRLQKIIVTTQHSSATAPPGYHGKYLRVDLTTGKCQSIELREEVLRSFLGGTGLGVFLMHQESQATVDPFDSRSALAFIFSPLVGSPLTTSAKFTVANRSPLTGMYNDSLASSGFAIAGKSAGWDAVVLVGQAEAPSIVIIDEDQIDLQPAEGLWGQSIPETERGLQQRLGSQFCYATIGPAGEQQVRFATISHDGRHAGRGGSGAILGSKQIKAIAIRGNQRPRWFDPAALTKYSKDLSTRSFGPATAKYRELGTASNLLTFNRLKTLPTRNFQRGSFEGAKQLAPETLSISHQKTRHSCVACTIGCEHVYQLDKSGDGVRLEYENLFALGSLCEVDDPEIVLHASKICDQLGIDTISAGATIAFAMECVQRGLLNESWLQFGNGPALLRALDLIGNRRGFGDQLAEGSRRLAVQIGQNSADFAPHVKGLEIPGYEPRGLQAMALGFAVSARGADHNRSGAYEADFSEKVDRRQVDKRSVRLAIQTENQAAIMDSLILCKFLRGVFDDFLSEAAGMLHLVTGWDMNASELQQTANRIVATKKLFNIQAGWHPKDDTLPKRFLSEPLPDDPKATLTHAELHSMVIAYNRERGWTDEGWLKPDSLTDLKLDTLLVNNPPS